MKDSIIILLTLLMLTIPVAVIDSEPVIARIGCESFRMDKNRLAVPVLIDGKPQFFLLGLGVLHSEIYLRENNSKAKYTDISLDNQIFSCKSKRFIIRSNPEYYENPFAGLLANDFFKSGKGIIHLDFDHSKICNLEQKTVQLLISESGYKEIDAKFTEGSFQIAIKINWKEHKFGFDTAFPGCFSMAPDDELPFLKENHKTITNSAGDLQIYENKTVCFEELYYSSCIDVSGDIKNNRVGMGFIKGFNWLIDYEHKKVYVQKSRLSLDKYTFSN